MAKSKKEGMMSASGPHSHPCCGSGSRHHKGMFFIVVGLIWAAYDLGYFNFGTTFWPILFILIGLKMYMKYGS